jgi:hypothetical protein
MGTIPEHRGVTLLAALASTVVIAAGLVLSWNDPVLAGKQTGFYIAGVLEFLVVIINALLGALDFVFRVIPGS